MNATLLLVVRLDDITIAVVDDGIEVTAILSVDVVNER